MITKYNKVRYDDNLGYRILHVTGTNTGESALPYLHHCLNYMLLYFTNETPDRVKEVIKAYIDGLSPDTKHTRGLYYRGTI